MYDLSLPSLSCFYLFQIYGLSSRFHEMSFIAPSVGMWSWSGLLWRRNSFRLFLLQVSWVISNVNVYRLYLILEINGSHNR
jgi:hypothetical protein